MTSKTNLRSDVTEFQLKMGQHVAKSPGSPSTEECEFRKKLISEECRELMEAIDSRDPVKVAMECIDLIYVVIGCLVVFGLPFIPIWKKIHAANMKKKPAGGPRTKPLKDEDWEPADKSVELMIRYNISLKE